MMTFIDDRDADTPVRVVRRHKLLPFSMYIFDSTIKSRLDFHIDDTMEEKIVIRHFFLIT